MNQQAIDQAANFHICPAYFSPAFFVPGQRVMCNGYEGRVVRHDCEGMWLVRVPGGVTCVSGAGLQAL